MSPQDDHSNLSPTSRQNPREGPEILPEQDELNEPTPAMEHHNGIIFFLSYILIYLAAPVTYIGIVQAALIDKLGANYMVASLPASLVLLGGLGPLIFSWLVPYHRERSVIVWAYGINSSILAVVFTTLIFPVSNTIRIGALLFQGFVQGICNSVAHAFKFQILRRGTTTQGRARILRISFGFTPLAAVLGSLGAQVILSEKFSFLQYPLDFACLYAIGIPCLATVAFLSSRYQLIPVKKKKENFPLLPYLWKSIRSFFSNRALSLAWIAYVLWYFSMSCMPNLSLYTKVAMGRAPKEFSGLIMALRFGFKCAAGFLLGSIAVKWGIRAPVITAVLLTVAGLAWAWLVPGYGYLLSFGLLGAGELGGAYLPNYVVSVSPATEGARNMSVLALGPLSASIGPATHGALTDGFGFKASFAVAIISALISLRLVFRLPYFERKQSTKEITHR